MGNQLGFPRLQSSLNIAFLERLLRPWVQATLWASISLLIFSSPQANYFLLLLADLFQPWNSTIYEQQSCQGLGMLNLGFLWRKSQNRNFQYTDIVVKSFWSTAWRWAEIYSHKQMSKTDRRASAMDVKTVTPSISAWQISRGIYKAIGILMW